MARISESQCSWRFGVQFPPPQPESWIVEAISCERVRSARIARPAAAALDSVLCAAIVFGKTSFIECSPASDLSDATCFLMEGPL